MLDSVWARNHAMTKQDRYTAAIHEIKIRLAKGGDLTADWGNTAAVLAKRQNFFWIGFYFVREDKLVLGPFQGKPACVFLPFGKGVCYACMTERKTILVPDVGLFPGHIACDSASKSEIAVPLFDGEGRVIAVLDVDSDQLDAFDQTDRENLETVGRILESLWPMTK